MALFLRADRVPAHVYVLMGMVSRPGVPFGKPPWPRQNSGCNLTAIIDRNRLQISSCTEDVMPVGNLEENIVRSAGRLWFAMVMIFPIDSGLARS